MKGIIKERRTAYFCHFSTDFFNFSTIFQHSFQQKASFPQKSAVLRANTLYWKKYGYCWKLKFSTSAAYAQRRAFLEMRLKHFWLYTPESEPTAWTRKSLIAAAAHMRESENALWAKTRRRNMAAPRRRTERSESAAKRARKAPPPRRQPPHFHPAPPKLCAKQICAHSWHEERTAETLPNRPHRFPRPAYTLPRRFLFTAFAYRRAQKGAPAGHAFSERSSQICALEWYYCPAA